MGLQLGAGGRRRKLRTRIIADVCEYASPWDCAHVERSSHRSWHSEYPPVRESVSPPSPFWLRPEMPQLLARPEAGESAPSPPPENKAGRLPQSQEHGTHTTSAYSSSRRSQLPSASAGSGPTRARGYPVRVLTHHPTPPDNAVLTLPSGVLVAVPLAGEYLSLLESGSALFTAFIPCVLTLSPTLPHAALHLPRSRGHVLVLQPIYRRHAGPHTLQRAGRAEAPASGHNKARRRFPRSSNPKGIAPQEGAPIPCRCPLTRHDALTRTKRLTESQSTLPLEDMVVCSHDDTDQREMRHGINTTCIWFRAFLAHNHPHHRRTCTRR
jgi:hypothetical protein